jgi:protein involved in polysaccharide export with SLBB domain
MKPRFTLPAVVLLLAALAMAPLALQAQAVSASTRDTMEAKNLLRPGDVIKLTVWREPDWSGEFPVDESGVATLPRLGPVNVTGMTPDSLKRFVQDSLGVFLKNPSIEITPLRRVQVLGAVRTPGLYTVAGTVTVGDVVALAGGASADGKPDQVVLRRNGQDLRVKLASQTRLADTPIRAGDQLFVPQRSWVGRNAGLVAAGISATTTLVVALLLR